MPKFIFAYHGGKAPDSPEEGKQVMAAWENWMSGLGAAMIDGGAPAGKSHTVTAAGVRTDGGANPISGYSFVEAGSLEAAVDLAKGCPILENGSVEVAEILPM